MKIALLTPYSPRMCSTIDPPIHRGLRCGDDPGWRRTLTSALKRCVQLEEQTFAVGALTQDVIANAWGRCLRCQPAASPPRYRPIGGHARVQGDSYQQTRSSALQGLDGGSSQNSGFITESANVQYVYSNETRDDDQPADEHRDQSEFNVPPIQVVVPTPISGRDRAL
jgi:hypothetical protein